MNENETTALVRAFDRAYLNGKFVTPHGTQVLDLVNPTNNTVTVFANVTRDMRIAKEEIREGGIFGLQEYLEPKAIIS